MTVTLMPIWGAVYYKTTGALSPLLHRPCQIARTWREALGRRQLAVNFLPAADTAISGGKQNGLQTHGTQVRRLV